jgi:hypothetical protein
MFVSIHHPTQCHISTDDNLDLVKSDVTFSGPCIKLDYYCQLKCHISNNNLEINLNLKSFSFCFTHNSMQ